MHIPGTRRPTPLLLALSLMACGVEPPPTYQLVETNGRLGSDLPAPTVLPKENFTTCGDLPDDAFVELPPWDYLTLDGVNVESATDAMFLLRSDLQSYDPCDTSASGAIRVPLLCDARSDTTSVLDGDARAKLCSPSWLACYHFGTAGGDAGWPIFPTDILHMPAIPPEIIAGCRCDGPESARTDLLYFAKQNWDENSYFRTRQGDSSITVVNTASAWHPESNPSADANAGICGVWVYGQEDFEALTRAPDEDDEIAGYAGSGSLLQRVCGAIGVPDVCASGGCDDLPQPLSVLRADLPIGGEAAEVQSYLVGGAGDLASAFSLAPVDAPERACPTCRVNGLTQECRMVSGAAALRYGVSLRTRAAAQGGPIHIVAAECPAPGDFAGSGWQRACWHVEVPTGALLPNSHLRIEVGGITSAVARPLDEWLERQQSEETKDEQLPEGEE